jgi:hypothetical protein
MDEPDFRAGGSTSATWRSTRRAAGRRAGRGDAPSSPRWRRRCSRRRTRRRRVGPPVCRPPTSRLRAGAGRGGLEGVVSEPRGAGGAAGRRGEPRQPGLPETLDDRAIAAGGEGVAGSPTGGSVFVHRTRRATAWSSVTERRAELGPGPQLVRCARARRPTEVSPLPFYAVRRVHARAPASTGAAAREGTHRRRRACPDRPAQRPRSRRWSPSPRSTATATASPSRCAGWGAAGSWRDSTRSEAPERVVDIDRSLPAPGGADRRGVGPLRSAWGPDARRLPSGERLRLTLRASDRRETSPSSSRAGSRPGTRGAPRRRSRGLVARSGIAPAGAGRSSSRALRACHETWGDETVDVTARAPSCR